MKRFFNIIMLTVVSASIFIACRKNFSEEKYIEEPTEDIKPDFLKKVNTSVVGFVTNDKGKAVQGATVTAGSKVTTTNEFGYFSIQNVSLPAVAGMVKVSYPNFFDGYKTMVVNEGKEHFVRLQLTPKQLVGQIIPSNGGEVNTLDGAQITFPAGSIVLKGTTTVYPMPVKIYAHWFNPVSNELLQTTMPGDLRGIDSGGYMKLLTTFGMVAVELSGHDDEKNLQIAPGKQATISMPIPTALAGIAPATIPLWYFDETTGLWKEEGVATKTGSSYVGNVSHFSFWNCDVPTSLTSFTTQIVNSNLQPLTNVVVQIAPVDQPNDKRWGYTDNTGQVFGYVPVNANLVLSVMDNCAVPAYSKTFQTTANQAFDLGAIAIDNIDQYISIVGTVSNCNNQPVTDGIVFLTEDNFTSRSQIINGSFSYLMLNCNATPIDINAIAWDYANAQQSSPKTVTISPGLNNLGELKACGVSADEFITYTIDAEAEVSIVPTEHIEDSIRHILRTDSLNIIYAYFLANDNVTYGNMNFAFDGGTKLGDRIMLLFNLTLPKPEISANSTQGILPTVVITEYGAVNEFVAGSFQGNFIDANSIPHTINCRFRVRRVQ